MDLNAILGLAASIGVPTVGGILATGKLFQRVRDTEKDLDILRGEVEQAQDAALKVGGLAQSVENMGQRFADQIAHMVEVMSLNNSHVQAQLTDIKSEISHVRSNAQMAKELATRSRRRVSDDA